MPDDDEDEEPIIPTKGYLKVFSLQAGTCMTSTVGVALMVCVAGYNAIAENRYSPAMLQLCQYSMIYLYCLSMFIGFIFVSFASFLAVPKTLGIGYYINLFGFLFWIVLCIVGYIPSNDAFQYVCIDNRCPETHWMYDSRWRNYGFPCPFGNKDSEGDGGGDDDSGIDMEDKNKNLHQKKNTNENESSTTENLKTTKTEHSKSISKLSSQYIGCENYKEWPMVTSTLLGVIWGIFMSYGLYTFKQFKNELIGDLEYE